MKKIFKKSAVAVAVAFAFSGSVFAQATLTNGSVTVKVDASGNIDSGSYGAPGLSFMGTEYINWGSPSSFYQLDTATPFGSFTAHYGTNPLGAVTTGGPIASTTYAFGGLNVFMLHALTSANQYSTTITLTNPGTTAVTGVQFSVGFDPDQGVPGDGDYVTTNKITGVGGSAAVTAFYPGLTPVTLANTTGIGAYLVKAYVAPWCCSAWSAATALAGGQALGYSSTGDQDIVLGYDIGTIAAGHTASFGYSYTFANPVPEPETYAMLLAGLGLMGFVARRRQRKLAAA